MQGVMSLSYCLCKEDLLTRIETVIWTVRQLGIYEQLSVKEKSKR